MLDCFIIFPLDNKGEDMGNIQSGGGKTTATLEPLPDIGINAISAMTLNDFLVKYGGVTRTIAEQFASMYTNSTSQQTPVINVDMYVLFMKQDRKNVLQTLRSSYVVGIDYLENAMPKSHSHGGHGGKEVLLTPDCFKRLCMRSKTANSEVVRTYFLRMESLSRMYFGAKSTKLQTNVQVLLNNQRPKMKSDIVEELKTTQGYIYIFPVHGRVSNLWRIGSSIDIKRRFRTHGSSHADNITYTRIKVYDVRKVESTITLWLSEFKYRKEKEVFRGNYELFKSMVLTCATASAIVAAIRSNSNTSDAFMPEVDFV